MNVEKSEIIISRTADDPIDTLQTKLKPWEIGIRILRPLDLHYDFICKNERARDTLIYMLERIAAAVVYKEVRSPQFLSMRTVLST